MNIDFKITSWERVSVDDDQKDLIIKALERDEIQSSNDVIELLGDKATFEGVMPETDEQMVTHENDYQSTIEVLVDTETVYTNEPKVKPLYYVVEHELEDIDGIGESTGNKTIQLYLIESNLPVNFGTVHTTTDVSSEEAINDHFEDNDLNIDEYELKVL